MRLRIIFSILVSLSIAPSGVQATIGDEGPNDPYYSSQLALSSDECSGSSFAEAWHISRDASTIITAVIDTGAELDHPDLADNLWVNSNEIPGNSIDDDGNGYVDDIHGYDFRNKDGNPEDQWGHGTLSAGIIGAVGNNQVGTTGVVWSAQLMILKVFGASGGGRLKDFAEAIRYAIHQGAKVINAGWIIPPSYPGDQIPLLMEALEEAHEAGVLVVAAAGNDSANLDEAPVFPASYSFDNVVAVAALKVNVPNLLEESNYGKTSVAVATTGEEVLGPYLSHGYATLTGTSAATALVSGMASLMFANEPDLTPAQVRARMIETSETADNLQGVLQSEGVLNPYAALTSGAIPASVGNGSDDGSDDSTQVETSLPAQGGCSLIP